MKTTLFLTLFVVMMANGCGGTRDVTSRPAGRTDFIPSRTYRIAKPVFLFKYDRNDDSETPRLAPLGFGGTPADPAQFRTEAHRNPQVAGMLMPGELIKVTRFVEDKSVTLGTFFEVYGVVATGEFKGIVVLLNLISKEGHPTSQAHVDTGFLEPGRPEE